MNRYFLLMLVIPAFFLMASLPAQARIYKNPVHSLGSGKYAAGVSHDSFTRALTSDGLGDFDATLNATGVNFTIGMGESGGLGLHFAAASGSINGGADSSGGGGGISYRHTLEKGDLGQGFLVSHFSGYVENTDAGVWFDLTDVMYGISKPISPTMRLYGGGGLSLAEIELEIFFAPYYTYAASASSVMGLFGGLELQPSETLLLGAEVHLMHEGGFGVYVDFLF